jgi:hypothetical protein
MAYTSESLDMQVDLVLKTGLSDSAFWIVPQSEDLTSTFFATGKHNSIKTTGSYTYKGEAYNNCQTKNCLASVDCGRGVFSHSTTWFWATFQTTLQDGSPFGVNFGDGIGKQAYHETNRASEDFLIHKNTAHKLDVTSLDYKQNDYMHEMKFKTIGDSGCDLIFTPTGNHVVGNNLVFAAFVQNLVYGLWTGSCEYKDLEGKS